MPRTLPSWPRLDQVFSTVAMDADGDNVVTWSSLGQDGSVYGVYGQRYNAAGLPQGGEFRVNTTTAGDQRFSTVAMDADRDFVVTWSSLGQDGSVRGIYGQHYNAAGLPQGGEFQVNTTTAGDQLFSTVAMDADGDFVVTWTSLGQDGSGYGVYGRRYNAAGLPQGGEFQVNTTTASDQLFSTVAMDADGDFVVTWSSFGQDGSGYGVYGRHYNAAGLPQGGEFRVNSTTASDQRFSTVAMDADGDFVVTWSSFGQDGSGFGVYGQRFALNQAPLANAGGPYTVAEGGSVLLDASATNDPDQSSATLTYAWDLDGDSAFGETGSQASRGDEIGPTPTFSAAGLDGPSSLTVHLRVTDDAGLSSTASATIDVTNVAPVITGVTGPPAPLALGTAASLTVIFTDAGIPDTHAATFAWDDGTPNTTVPDAGSPATVGHTYAAAGVYTVTVTVQDDDTGTASSRYEYVVVYDASAGFVTGGGWINSPPGAYRSDSSLAGKANFGFVSKYQRGATVPTGQTEFQFKVANFNFHSSSYEWLVVAGARAQFKGTGTVNGTGNYGFLLTAIDGQLNGGGGTDKFRIKIWDKNNGDAIVYDNQVGPGVDPSDGADPVTALGGGSIVIHKPLELASGAAQEGQVDLLTGQQVAPLLTEALARWQAAGVDAVRLQALSQIPIYIVDLADAHLGLASSAAIWLDRDAAGHGWFVDATPATDDEFATPGTGPAASRVDLLTVLAHEVGHVLGYDHSHEDDLMSDTLAVGVRPVAAVSGAFVTPGLEDMDAVAALLIGQQDSAAVVVADRQTEAPAKPTGGEHTTLAVAQEGEAHPDMVLSPVGRRVLSDRIFAELGEDLLPDELSNALVLDPVR